MTAARETGRSWRFMPPEQAWAPVRAGHRKPTKLAQAATFARIDVNVAWAQVVHAHFATTASRLTPWFVPSRPYVLHLHGTDIRTRWASSAEHDKIQRFIDGASHVYYSTPDLLENATTARSDAEYLPIFVDPHQLPDWRPQPYVAVVSRWEEVKGHVEMLAVARGLISAGIEVRGLNWGPGAAEAAAIGVKLQPRMSHPDFLDFLSHASAALGQSSSILSVSEVEAMAIGVPLSAVGTHLPGPDGRPLPIREGSPDEVTEQLLADLEDPAAASHRLDVANWARTWHTAHRYLPQLDEIYRRVTSDS
ncbi:glycosyltransferase family 4 protein [Microbacterium sp. TS-1]|uniref:glycosyltransferase family 4 protein n=1 Tax=Microbacterium sp. TS-1 TaxID=1344956 RepID=UPI00040555C1|nr:glycosyltransferase family 4 protein [Microbacterium sp. TS-1]